jgi:ribosomal protein S18 acetylase RimI-like enzyme
MSPHNARRFDKPQEAPQVAWDQNLRPKVRIRSMTRADVVRLSEIDSNFESPIYLDVIKETNGLNVTWRLIQRPFDTPFVRNDFDFDDKEQREIARRLETGDGLWLVAQVAEAGIGSGSSGRLVGMIDVQRQAWREVGFVWNIAIDRAYRGQGLGRKLMDQVLDWGRRQGLRAIILETQTNNWYACRFYQRCGFQLTGIDDHFYTNQDVANKEVALFWTYEL